MVISGALYDAVGFPWSTMFTVGWNAAVCVAALCSLLGMGVCKMNRENQYVLLEGGNVEHATSAKQGDRQVNCRGAGYP